MSEADWARFEAFVRSFGAGAPTQARAYGQTVSQLIHSIPTPAPLGERVGKVFPLERGGVAYAKSRLAPYKVPKTIELVEVIPRSEATKVNRGRLVEARGG